VQYCSIRIPDNFVAFVRRLGRQPCPYLAWRCVTWISPPSAGTARTAHWLEDDRLKLIRARPTSTDRTKTKCKLRSPYFRLSLP